MKTLYSSEPPSPTYNLCRQSSEKYGILSCGSSGIDNTNLPQKSLLRPTSQLEVVQTLQLLKIVPPYCTANVDQGWPMFLLIYPGI